ncbi:vWA domain-containing protein [Planctomicrobium sp. SH668]|uniref:vWA domain-containing protein n=1 Tax=Planctomicrobium sp. SH668 TaxID=3448126 RepID=UPI003F5C35C1
MCSIILHLSALALMAALVFPVVQTKSVEAIFASNDVDTVLVDAGGGGGSGGDLSLDLSGVLTGSDADSSETREDEVAADLTSTAMSSDLPMALAALETSVASLAPVQSASNSSGQQSADSGAGAGSGSGSGGGVGAGKGRGYGNGKGEGTGDFFAIDHEGKSAVFVVDASRSMGMPYPGPAINRFNRVKLELLHTITQMTENERFFIIFFNENSHPMPADRLMEADPVTKHRYLTWMARFPAEGKTDPEVSLMQAVSLKPDVIYFLTDGDIRFDMILNVTKMNQGRVPIHTIGFGDDRGEKLMKELAARNQGTYKFIAPEEWEGEDVVVAEENPKGPTSASKKKK